MHLPSLRTNPFSTRPVEASNSNLLVGRHHLEDMLSQYLRFRSSRRILLVGEHGSGRTSLLRCVAKQAPHSVYIDHISPNNAGESLLKGIYSSFISSDAPAGRSKLTQKILEAAQSYRNALPLIVIDASTLDIGALNVALRETLPTLERLQALVVVVLESKDKALLHDSIVQQLDQLEPLANLSVDEVQLLVERRIEQATGEQFSFSVQDAEYLHEKTHGLPAAVIRLMRDSIDRSNMSKYTYIEPSYTSPDSIEPESHEGRIEPLSTGMDMFSIPDDASLSDGSVLEEVDPSSLSSESEHEEIDAKVMESIEEVTNFFDLDLEQLDQEQSLQEELKELETIPEGFNAVPSELSEPASRPPLDASIPTGWTGLFERNRSLADAKTEDTQPQPEGNLVEASEAYSMWEDASLHQPEVPQEIPEEESAVLLHDDIGLPIIEPEHQAIDSSFEEPIEYYEAETVDEQPALSHEILDGLADIVPVMKALHLALLTPIDGDVASQRRHIVEALERMQTKKQGRKQDYAFNAHVLSALSSHEMAVISVANDRTYSPSDKELLRQLNVKRARLSQISNRLLKFGILSVRSVGRNRYFDLTQAARAQLMAWNVLGGEA